MAHPAAQDTLTHDRQMQPAFVAGLSWYAVATTLSFPVALVIADFVVPDHDWIADTISDLGAGRYEFIVDIGLYAYASALLALALVCAHLHTGRAAWSAGCIGLAALSLIVFLVGARNEYGDGDSEGVVIHIYLVYALGGLFAVVPFCLAPGIAQGMAQGTAQGQPEAARWLRCLALAWIVAAPVFFILPDTIDGIYERGLGLIAMAMTLLLCRVFLRQSAARG